MNATTPIIAGLTVLNVAVLLYFLTASVFSLVLLAGAVWELRRHLITYRVDGRWRLLRSATAPTVSLLVPAYDEAKTIGESVRSVLGLYYPQLEVVVINDGSTDATLDVLMSEFLLVPVAPVFRKTLPTRPVVGLYRSTSHPNLLVVDKQNGGKADALNAGLNIAASRLVCAVDADTLIEPEAIQRMVWPFITTAGLAAVGGTVRIANGSLIRGGRVVVARTPRQPVSGVQVVEYLRGFLVGRLGWNLLGGSPIISGAFGLFDRMAVLDAGGYATGTVGEDVELVVRLRRRSYELSRSARVVFVPDPVAWTEGPSTLRMLGRQRERWQRGLAEMLWRHRRLLLNPRYGSLGLIAIPYFLMIELLGPVAELIGLVGLILGLAWGAVDLSFAVVYFLAAYGLGACLTCFALVLEEFGFHRYETTKDRLILLGWAVVESVGYRHLTVWWRVRGLVQFFRGGAGWGRMQRQGFTQQPVTPAGPATGSGAT